MPTLSQQCERYTLEDALVVGMFLNAFIRHANAIKLANMAQLVNVIAPIYTNPKGLFLQTTFYPMQLYSLENGTIALDVGIRIVLKRNAIEKHHTLMCLPITIRNSDVSRLT